MATLFLILSKIWSRVSLVEVFIPKVFATPTKVFLVPILSVSLAMLIYSLASNISSVSRLSTSCPNITAFS